MFILETGERKVRIRIHMFIEAWIRIRAYTYGSTPMKSAHKSICMDINIIHVCTSTCVFVHKCTCNLYIWSSVPPPPLSNYKVNYSQKSWIIPPHPSL